MKGEAQEIPCTLTIAASDLDCEILENTRLGLDLVCVVDTSGSMSGEKIDLCKKTL